MLLFTASDFTSTTRHICNWALFLLWPSHFILSGAISLLFPSSILDISWPGGLIFQCHIFFLFILFMGFPRQEYWSGSPFPSPWTTFCQTSPWPVKARILKWFTIPFSMDHILSELSTNTSPSWVWLIASLSYTRLWSLWSFRLAFVIMFLSVEAVQL